MEKLQKNKLKRTKGITLEISLNKAKGKDVRKDFKQEKAITLM